MNPRIFIIVAATIWLAACASYKTPDELRAHTQHKTSAAIEVEHKKLYTETLKQQRLCWERVGTFAYAQRVTGDFFETSSAISVGIYSMSDPKILFVFDMQAAGTKTEVTVSGVNAKTNEMYIEKMKLFAVGKSTSWCE